MKLAGWFCLYVGGVATVTLIAAGMYACPPEGCRMPFHTALADVTPVTLTIGLIVGLIHAGLELVEREK